MKEITKFDSKKNGVFSQKIPDMKEYFKQAKIRVDKIEEDAKENKDDVIK